MGVGTREHGSYSELDPMSADTQKLATLNEEQTVQVQLQSISQYTVEPGLLRLPVKKLTTAKNSEQMVFELDHPFIDSKKFRFYMEKPAYWSEDYEFVEIMEAYGYGPGNIYHIQTDKMYTRYDEKSEEWKIVKPPKRPKTRRGKVKQRMVRGTGKLSTTLTPALTAPRSSMNALLAFTLYGMIIGVLGAAVVSMNPVYLGAGGIITAAASVVLGMMVIPPP